MIERRLNWISAENPAHLAGDTQVPIFGQPPIPQSSTGKMALQNEQA
jgi:hypothetical protein